MPRPELSTLRYPNLWQGCVGAWCPSQSGATGYRLFDDSGNNNHGVLTGTTPNNWTSDDQKLSISYTGLGVSSRMPQTPVLNLTGPLTVCTWLKYSLAQGSRGIVAKSGDATQYHISTGAANNRTLTFNIRSGATNYSVATTGLYNDNLWHFVAGVYDKNNVIINIDGGREVVIGPSVTGDIDLTNPALFIGCFNNSGGSFVGLVDDTRIYNRALAPYEIRQLASSRGAAYERSRGRKKAYVPGYRITAPSRIQTGSARTIDGTDTESLSRGLVGAWCPSLGASGYRLIDRSGNNNHGTLTGMDPGTDWVPSGGKLALDFDGSNDGVRVDSDKYSYSSGAISFWVATTTDSVRSAIAFQETTTFNNLFIVYLGDGATGVLSNELITIGSIKSAVSNIGAYTTTTRSEIFDGKMHHVVAMSNGTTWIIYLDGVPKTVSLGQGTNGSWMDVSNPSALSIGCRLANSNSPNLVLNGQIDDVRIWNRTLTASEIRLLYTGGRGVGLLPEAKPKRARIVAWDNQDKISVPARVLTNTDSLKRGLVGHWSPSLSGPQGNRLMDLSGQNNHGTLTNMDYQTDYVPSAEKGGRMALDFDGVNDYTTIPMNPIFNMPNVKTISAWIYSRSYDGQSQVNDIINTDNINTLNRTWQFAALDENNTNNDAKLNLFSFGTGGGTQSISTLTEVLQVGIWHHVACTTADGLITPSQVFLYVDGIPQSTTVTSTGSYIGPNQLTVNNSLNFGRRPGHSSQDLHFNGFIDDVRIYNRVLTPNEIRLLAQSRQPERATPQRTRTVFYSSGLVSYLRRRTYNSILGSGVLS